MGLFSFLRKPKLAPEAKAALLVYLKAEVELAEVKTKALDEYARALEEASVLQNLVDATSRYLETLNSIATRHASIEVPSEGTDCFLAHEILFKSYRLLGRGPPA